MACVYMDFLCQCFGLVDMFSNALFSASSCKLMIQIFLKQIINCIWKHPDARTVYLTCDLLGQEDILVEVSQTFGEKIYVDKSKKLECYKSLELIVPEIISQDSSSRLQLFDGFPKLYERAEAMFAEARANFQPEPLIIRSSSQWYACDSVSDTEKQRKERFDQAVRDLCGVWHVCYSIHSSREELEWALQLLAPKWVVSTTPNCRAMELDYVKKHCFYNRQAFGVSLQKLLDISAVATLGPDESLKGFSCSNVVETIANVCVETQPEPVVISTRQRKRLSLSPPSKRPMITLFGRARLGVQDSILKHEPNQVPVSNDSKERVSIETEDAYFQEDVTEVKSEELLETKKKADFADTRCTSSTDVNSKTRKPGAISPISYSNSYNENLRKLYRSRNVPIPQRLPSIVKLLDAKKSARKRI